MLDTLTLAITGAIGKLHGNGSQRNTISIELELDGLSNYGTQPFEEDLYVIIVTKR